MNGFHIVDEMIAKKYIIVTLMMIIGIALSCYFIFKPNGMEFKSVDCFDYYKFGENFFTYAVAEKESYNVSDNVTFFYTINNPTEVPITDAAIRVQILYNGEDIDRSEGDDLIDEFFVVRNINLNPGDSYSGEFDWKIPKDMKSGLYKANFYLVSEDKFNMVGLSFIPNVVGAETKFDVKSDYKNMIRFDRNSTYVNEGKYKFRSFFPIFSPGDDVTIKTELVNEGDEKNVSILYQVFKFDDLDSSEEIKSYTKTETITLEANSKIPITFDLGKQETNAYLIELTATSENQKSILKLRAPVTGKEGRFVFLGINKFPITAGKTSAVFCLTNVGAGPCELENQFKGNIKIELFDKDNNLLFEGVEKVDVDGSVTGYMFNFNSKNSYSYAVLKATLYDEKGTHDLMTVVYDYSKFWNITRLFDVEILNTNVETGNDLKFVVSFKDNFGDSLEGNIFSYISDSSGKVITTIPEKSFKGSTEISIPANLPLGKYKLTVIEKEFENTVSKEFNVA